MIVNERHSGIAFLFTSHITALFLCSMTHTHTLPTNTSRFFLYSSCLNLMMFSLPVCRPVSTSWRRRLRCSTTGWSAVPVMLYLSSNTTHGPNSTTCRRWRTRPCTATNTVSFPPYVADNHSGMRKLVNRLKRWPRFTTVASLTAFPRIHPAGESDVAAHAAVCAGPEDGHAAAWRWGPRGEKGQEDAQVPAEYSICFRSLPLWHAGELVSQRLRWFMGGSFRGRPTSKVL